MPCEEWEKPRCRPHCLLSFETVGSFFCEGKEGSKGLHGEIAMERKARRETGWMKGGGRFEERTISPSFLSMSAFRPRSVRPFGFLRGCHNVSSQEEIFSTIKSVVVTTYIATDSL